MDSSLQGDIVKPLWLAALSALVLAAAALRADGPADNVADKVRPVPPPGVAIPAADRDELQAGADDLGKEIGDLRAALKDKPALLDLLPDVQIYHKAVRSALAYNEFYDVKQVATARDFLKQGRERAAALRDGKAPWTTATGLVARGYVSQHRRLSPALRVGRSGVVPSRQGRQAPPRPLVPRPQRGPDRAEIHQRLPKGRRRVHAGRRLRAAPLRPLLLRQQVRRRSRCLRGDGQRQEALSHRRQPRGDPRLLDGRGGVLALGRASP